MKEKTCCFTGHRKIPPDRYEMVARRLKDEIVTLIEQGYTFFGAGGALGFDTLAARTVLGLKVSYPHIKLILVLPCHDQTRGWSKADVEVYEQIKSCCDKFVYTSEEYNSSCMFKRNRHLLDNSSVCICYLTESKGGTAYTVDYAKKAGIRVINIA